MIISETTSISFDQEDDIRFFKSAHPSAMIVFLADQCSNEHRWRMEQLGVSGILLKSIRSEVLVASLNLISMGERVFSAPNIERTNEAAALLESSSSVRPAALSALSRQRDEANVAEPTGGADLAVGPDAAPQARLSRRGRLSDREAEILACLVSGNSNKLIARQCSITEATVKVHLKAILRKTDVANRTQAAVWAINHMAEYTRSDRVA